VQLQKILQVKDQLPEIRSIIQYKGNPPEDCPEVLSVSFLASFLTGLMVTCLAFVYCIHQTTDIRAFMRQPKTHYFNL